MASFPRVKTRKYNSLVAGGFFTCTQGAHRSISSFELMVLLGLRTEAKGSLLSAALAQAPHENHEEFLQNPLILVGHHDYPPGTALHVMQGEMGVSSFTMMPDLNLIGSDDATTCSIVLLGDADLVAVAHIDSDVDQAAFFIEKFARAREQCQRSGGHPAAGPIPVYIAGGYEDEQGISRPISESILVALAHSTLTFEVRLLYCGPVNTTSVGASKLKRLVGASKWKQPRSRGMAMIRMNSGGVMVRSVEFQDDARLPMLPLRCQGHSKWPLHELFDCTTDFTLDQLRIRVGPYVRMRSWSRVGDALLRLPDAEFLQMMSTSPFAEGPKFISDMKKAIQFGMSSPNLVPDRVHYFKALPLERRWIEEGG